ncbi:MAG: hypothetical protein A3F82_02290 [Deltaproteobacteria bacterium RIFCSPLOWO2_12_FULL_44_12]|nr:MAG: hypothetical protein A2712_02665 [Deltaproteobacteria bacterium RIFCSPHIGHO2_01_FULL_43_49]OGQ16098.1 MAG: hypothetical protein A3D22_00635 [Deltaproteobacteria bacterium RIFCSPHIGHO2_02_FULL_44_53]OGQ29059.1 MAG: hypothetical protein A3D98_04420 [Deltaproteobacteria bacterium RIFCSPHIGHO2_12_FULL_44_21]OGQ32615.1 MAG: hypothetical protein A2979_08565 [Deltaproteobacteria bacterium RIFCSPLOWO2_01_FULL_45_74]OGQ41716.1 MAG: hypothetical protein A3I70_08350 [Deltaproteobacteria bacterium 
MPLPDIGRQIAEEIKIGRQARMAQEVVFVGGLGGCGKTMLTPIIGSLERVEIQKYNYVIEHVCTLHSLDRIDDDVATTLIQMQVDLDIYNMMMSRETNFRFQDLSSIFKNPGTWRYLRRLFQAGDDAIPDRIQSERPILHITMHDLMQRAGILFLALHDQVRFINLVRHPLYMVKQWYVNFDTLFDAKSSREFSIWYEYRGENLPWFVREWEEKYIAASKMDKMIWLLARHLEHCDRVYHSIPHHQTSQILTIPFEHFVLDPWPYMKQIEKLLGVHMTRRTYKEMKRQKVPRKMIAEGIDLPIYRKYGWEPPKTLTEIEEMNRRREFVAKEASHQAMETLDRLCQEYERQYLS